MRHILTFAVALFASGAPLISAPAQGIPIGSTRVTEPPDSAFSSFVVFLKKQGASVIRVDSTRQRVEAKVKGSDESILFAFTADGDSTAITAQGTKGGMAALIFGLGTVKDWLDDRRATGPSARKP